MIRQAQIKDLPIIQELYKTLFATMATYEPHYMKDSPQDEAFIQSVIEGNNDFIIFVVEDNIGVQGFAIAQLQDAPPYNCFVQQRLVYLLDLVVHTDNRGKGYGKALIDEVKAWGIENKVDYFELNVLTQNQRAIELYLKEGLLPFSLSMRMQLDNIK